MKRNLIFLGTGTSQGVPVIGCSCPVCKSKNIKDNRLRSSVLLQLNKKKILIDSGPDFRLQCLRAGIDKLDAIFYTHEHRDHVAGVDELRTFYYKNKNPIPIYLTKRVFNALKQDYSYLFSEKDYFGKPKFDINIIEKSNNFSVFNINITPIEVMHYKLPVIGFRVFNLAYITDANSINKKEMEKLLNLDFLIINCLQIKPHISHFNLDQALELIEFLKPKCSYLTHISHNLGLHNKVQQKLPNNVFLAHDQLKINF
jgi:phosphoribosyl 1,2-cyclic phosphate phosphodiesterase